MISETHVLVPLEPTEAMLKAFDIDFVYHGNIRHAYRTMIAAASPSAEEAQ